MSVRRLFFITLLLLTSRCSRSCAGEQTWDVAIGWRGAVTSLFVTKCAPVAGAPTKIVAVGDEWEAVGAGTEDFHCDDDLVVHVRIAPAVRIEIALPSTFVTDEPHALVVWGFDAAGRKLDVGRQYTEALGGVLERTTCRNDMDFLCGLGADDLVAHKPGRGRVSVSFHGLTASRDVDAFAPLDAGPG